MTFYTCSNSPLRVKAMYLLGFFYGTQTIRKRGEAIKWMERVVKEYPNSKEAPESLWHIAFYYSWTDRQFDKGIPYLKQLQEQYPQSPRWKHTAAWIQIFEDKTRSN